MKFYSVLLIIVFSLTTNIFSQLHFTPHTITTDAIGASSVFATDVDGDGDMDVLSASVADGKIAWYENDGNEIFTSHTITTGADWSYSVYAEDLDSDGDMDVLSASWFDHKIAWYENDGSENFIPHTITTNAVNARSVYAIDVDGDGDIDVLSASWRDDKIAWYENDGNENFTPDTITTNAGGANSVYAIDVDGDGDIDVLSASWRDDKIAWYENDGNENFTTHTITTNASSAYSVYAIDVDGDGDMDVLSAAGSSIAWYENDGNENFTTHIITTNASGAYSVYAIDVDSDGDIDVLSASSGGTKIAWYENDGNENFTTYIITTDVNAAHSVYAIDLDGDLDIDVLSASMNYLSKIVWYENLGPLTFMLTSPNGSESWNGGTLQNITWADNITENVKIELYKGGIINFTITDSTPSDGIFDWNIPFMFPDTDYKIKITSVDNADIFDFSDTEFTIISDFIEVIIPNGGEHWLPGSLQTINWFDNIAENVKIELYKGGIFNFTIIDSTLSDGIYNWNIPISTAPDTDYKIKITSVNNSSNTDLSDNEFTIFEQVFTPQINLPGSYNSADWGDYDNDGDLDILAGRTIFANEGQDVFTEQVTLQSGGSSQSMWVDYDNDNDLDAVVLGNYVTDIYRNDGNNNFVLQNQLDLAGAGYGAADWGDYDNDGDLDLLLIGEISDDIFVNRIYRNEGNGSFVDIEMDFPVTFFEGSALWGDYDNDMDLDFILTGWVFEGSGQSNALIYKNEGGEIFNPQYHFNLSEVGEGSAAWGDYNADGYLDIVLTGLWFTGINDDVIYRTDLFLNVAGTNFTEQTQDSLIGVTHSSSIWGDYDNDGDLDLLVSGYPRQAPRAAVTILYRNDGDIFTEMVGENILSSSGIAFGDYDNDGDLDLLIASDGIIYKNNSNIFNTKPSVPTNLSVTVNSDEITLSWDKSTDNETPQDGLTYNIVLGTSPNSVDIVSPMADRSTGYRRIVDLGNTNHNNSWTIKNLALGTYYWSVQAIDNAFAGSDFSDEFSLIADFTSSFIITDNCANSVDLIFGTAPYATECYDPAYDLYAPPLPPSGAFDGRFVSCSEGFLKDIRGTNIDSTLVWDIYYQPATGCEPVSFSWSPGDLPAEGNFFLIDPTGGTLVNVDMRLDSSYTELTGLDHLQILYSYINTVVEVTNPAPTDFALQQNYPNPFNPVTTISYSLPVKSQVTLVVYNVLGESVTQLVNEEKEAGRYEAKFDATTLPSGVYFYRINAGSFVETKKMILMK